MPHEDRELALENERLRHENEIVVERTRKFKVEGGQKMIRGIISPTMHRQKSHLQHRAEPAGSQLPCTRAKPEPQVRVAKRAGDMSYIWTREGWLYLAVILDLPCRRVIALRDVHANSFRVTGWAPSDRLRANDRQAMVSNRMKRCLAIRSAIEAYDQIAASSAN